MKQTIEDFIVKSKNEKVWSEYRKKKKLKLKKKKWGIIIKQKI